MVLGGRNEDGRGGRPSGARSAARRAVFGAVASGTRVTNEPL